MQNPDNLDAAANRYIKNQVLAYRKTLQSGMKCVPVSPHVFEASEIPACLLNFVKEFVGIVGIVLGYIPPDFVKVCVLSRLWHLKPFVMPKLNYLS